jgi:hypothetical protein
VVSADTAGALLTLYDSEGTYLGDNNYDSNAYTFADLEYGSYSLLIERNGYSSTVTLTLDSDSLTYSAAIPTASISTHVDITAPVLHPVTRWVEVYAWDSRTDTYNYVTDSGFTTSPDYTTDALPYGKYRLDLQWQDYPALSAQSQVVMLDGGLGTVTFTATPVY